MACYPLLGQTTIKGRVIDGSLTPLAGASIFSRDTVLLDKADFNGYFEVDIEQPISELLFGYIGYEWTKIQGLEDCSFIEVILMQDGNYHMSNRKIDRMRKKRFDRLREMHLAARQKGLFKSDTTCYIQEFVPWKEELDKLSKELKEFRKLNKNEFKALNKGDIVKIPFGLDTSENRISTYYSPCSDCTEEDYDYVIEGKIINKKRRKLTLEIKITEMRKYDSLEYRGETLEVGGDFRYEMKYFEVIIN
ncbi:MAG: hypothetical protein AAF717_08065 [Bacteroidota bacterium]